jgi:predicted RNA-binding Zn ribbon-like protein
VDDTIAFTHPGGLGADLVSAALEAIAAGRWRRLKACPDCRWVFYDHSRNASKRWCLMTAGGPDGRSCGSIAKVRAHRRRTRTAE